MADQMDVQSVQLKDYTLVVQKADQSAVQMADQSAVQMAPHLVDVKGFHPADHLVFRLVVQMGVCLVHQKAAHKDFYLAGHWAV